MIFKQRIQVSQNSYVAKNQAKMPVGVTFWCPVYPTIMQNTEISFTSNINISIFRHNTNNDIVDLVFVYRCRQSSVTKEVCSCIKFQDQDPATTETGASIAVPRNYLQCSPFYIQCVKVSQKLSRSSVGGRSSTAEFLMVFLVQSAGAVQGKLKWNTGEP